MSGVLRQHDPGHLLADTRKPMSLTQISGKLERSASELFRLVQVLEFRGYVEAAESGEGYVLTDRLFTLGVTRAPTQDLLEASLPFMRGLAQNIN